MDEKTSNRMEDVVRAKSRTAGSLEALVAPFLSPELAAESAHRVLYQNSAVRAACPVYQRGVEESSTIDIGDHQVRGILVVPWAGCPIMSSHQATSAGSCALFSARVERGGRLIDKTEGFYPGSAAVQPSYRSFSSPAVWSAALNATYALPLHGGFYTPPALSSGFVLPTTQMFRCFTDQSSALGVSTGIRAIPCQASDPVSLVASGACTLAPNISLVLTTVDVAGVLTNTTTVVVNAVAVAGPNIWSITINCPAGAVGIVGAHLLQNATGVFTFDTMELIHRTLNSTVSLGMGLGTYIGGPVSGLVSLLPTCQAARVTALSLKISNTSSALNANGYITGIATQDCMPDCVGILGETTIKAFTSARTFKFTDGSYMALAPPVNLKYSPLDSGPPTDCPFGVYIVSSQDATAITMKLEWHMLFEVVSQDPLFAPSHQEFNPAQVAAIQHCQEAGGYLVLSENPFHWGSIGSALSKAVKGVSGGISGAAKAVYNNPKTALAIAAGLGVPGAALATGLYQARRNPGGAIASMFQSQNRQTLSPPPQSVQPRVTQQRVQRQATENRGMGGQQPHRPWGMPRSQWHALGH